MILRQMVALGCLVAIFWGGAVMAADGLDGLYRQRQLSDPRVEWTQFGPGLAGMQYGIWYHPTDPDVVFLTPDMFNSYRSVDNGQSWVTVKDYDGSNNPEDRFERVWNMDFSRQNPDFGMAVNGLGLWVTRDRGASWQAVDHSIWGGWLSAVAFDPSDDQTIFVGSGRFWQIRQNARTYDHLRGGPHPFIGQAGPTNTGKLWKSTDGGQTWQRVDQDFPSQAEFGQIRVDPHNSSIVYAVTSYGFFRSTDGGNHWETQHQGLDVGLPMDLAVHYDEESGQTTLYMIDQVVWQPDGAGSVESIGGIYKSLDHGESWVNINSNLGINLRQLNDSAVTGAFFSNRGLGGWFGINNPQSLYRLPQELLPRFNRIVVDPRQADRVYIAHDARISSSFPPNAIWMTEDGGENWFPASRMGTIWANRAAFWRQLYQPEDVDLTQINMDFGHKHQSMLRSDPANIMQGISGLTINSEGHVFSIFGHHSQQSLDDGRSWRQMDSIETAPGTNHWVGRGNSNLPGRFIYQDARFPEAPFFTSGEHGLWRLAPDGDQVSPGAVAVYQTSAVQYEYSPADIAMHPRDADTIYMLHFRQRHAGEFRRSTDGGRTWQVLSRPFPSVVDRVHQYSLLIDPEQPHIMYFCAPATIINDVGQPDAGAQKGVYRSVDRGYSWQVMNQGLPSHASVHRLAFDPKDSKVLYAAVLEHNRVPGGLYRTSDGAETWQRVEVPEPITQVVDVHFDRDAALYIAAGSAGGSIESGGIWRRLGSDWEKVFAMPSMYGVVTAAYDANRILAIVGPGQAVGGRNPGIYFSSDYGQSGIKINVNLGQPGRIFAVAFDLEDPNILWATQFGSGFTRGILHDDLEQVYQRLIAPDAFALLNVDTSIPEAVRFSWESAGVTEYQLFISRDKRLENQIYSATVHGTDHLVHELEYGGKYFWTVRAVPQLPWHSSGESEYLPYVQGGYNMEGAQEFTISPAPAPPEGPQEVTAASVFGEGVRVGWTPVEFVNQYQIFRRQQGEEHWQLQASVSRSTVHWIDKNVVPGKSYLYRIQAVNDQGSSVPSSAVEVYVAAVRTAFDESFASGRFTNPWRSMGAWSFARQDGQDIAHVRALFPRATGSMGLDQGLPDNYRLHVRLRFAEWGNLAFAQLRIGASLASGEGIYVAYSAQSETIGLSHRSGGSSRTMATAVQPLELGTWYDFVLEVTADGVGFSLEDDQILFVPDFPALSSGGLELFISNMAVDIAAISVLH